VPSDHHEAPIKLTWKGRFIALVAGTVIMVMISEGVLRIAMPNWRDFNSRRFNEATWVEGYGRFQTGVPGFDGYFAQNNGDFRTRIRINKFGLRNTEPISSAHNRIWVIGDSMAFGWGVESDSKYSSVIAKITGEETYNIASPGTSICGYQGLLARMPKKLTPRVIIMGLVLENDVTTYDCQARAKRLEASRQDNKAAAEHITFYSLKRYLTENSAFYNFLAVALKRVAPISNTLMALGIIKDIDIYTQHLSDDQFNTAIKETMREILVFQAMFPKDVPFAVLLAPGRFELRDGSVFFKKLRLTMKEHLMSKKISVIDPFKEFKAKGYEKVHFIHDGHWTPVGHEIAAQAVARWLGKYLDIGKGK
jgi:hypothetical protein